MTHVSITRLRLRSKWHALPLAWQTLRIALQAKRAPGIRDVRLLRDANNAFWTATSWVDEASMRAFMMKAPHRHMIPKIHDWCDESAVVRWSQDTAALPDWKEAHRRLLAEGRPTKLRHPSEAHLAFRIPEPKA
jgi:hypothetical protein